MRQGRKNTRRAVSEGRVTKAPNKKREKKVAKKSAFATYLEAAANTKSPSETDPPVVASDNSTKISPVQSMDHEEDQETFEKDTVMNNTENINQSVENSALEDEDFTTMTIHDRYFKGITQLPNPTEMILDKDVSLPVSSVDSSDVSDEDIPYDEQQIKNKSYDFEYAEVETCNDVGVFAVSPCRSHVLLGIGDKAKILGCGYIKVLKGRVEILGSVLEAGDGREVFFAPVTDYALEVKSDIAESNSASSHLPLSDLMNDPTIKVPESAIEDFVGSHPCVLLLSSLDCSDSKTYPGYSEIFKLRRKHILQDLCNGACLARTSRCFECFSSYIKAADSIFSYTGNITDGDVKSGPPIILTVGGKGTGKSTFNRYLVNKMLPLYSSINYLDCDIGQPEFTLPGFISLTCVKSPLLGPPFTHLQDSAHAVYYGMINCAGQPDHYIKCVKEVLAHRDPALPLIVNTMGWIRGLGLNLLMDIIHLVQPSHIIQISGVKGSKNLPVITRDFVNHSEGWCKKSTSTVSNFQHLIVETNLEIYEEPGYNPSDLRILRVLSYLNTIQKHCGARDFGASFDAKLSLRSLSAVKPYKVKLSDIALYVCHESGIRRDFALSVFNASLVGLSSIDGASFEECSKSQYLSDPPNCKCWGIAIVRGVDVEQKCLYVVSHLPKETLKNINCLILGSLTIPECMYEPCKSPACNSDTIPPYVTIDFPFQVAGSGKFRVYRSK